MADSLQDILECHICAEKYNLTDRRPKILKCGHRFCLGCLDLLGQQNHINIKCPNCQRVCDIPSGGVKSFTDNFTIIDLMESQKVTAIPTAIAAASHDNITDCVMKLQGIITNLEAQLLALNVGGNLKTTEKNIEDAFHKMLQQLERRKYCLVEEFKDIKEKEIRNLAVLNQSIRNANMFLTLTQQQLRDGTLQDKPSLQRIFAECERQHDIICSLSLKKPDIKFRFSTYGLDDLMNGIASFGSLVKEDKETVSEIMTTQNDVTPLTEHGILARKDVSMFPPEQRYNNIENCLQILPLSRIDAPLSFAKVNPSAVVEFGKNLMLLDSQQPFVGLLETEKPRFLSYFPIKMPSKGQNLYSPCGIAVDTEHNIIIIDNASIIYVISTGGQCMKSFSILRSGDVWHSKFPNIGLACDANNDIYIWCSKYKILRVFNKNGILLRDIAPVHSSFEEPFISSICIHAGKIYIADSKVSTIAVYSIQGDLIKTMGSFGDGKGQLKNPEGVAVDKRGLILVADSGNQRIQVISPNGQFLISFGETVLDMPCYISVLDKGQVVVCDRGKQHLMMLK